MTSGRTAAQALADLWGALDRQRQQLYDRAETAAGDPVGVTSLQQLEDVVRWLQEVQTLSDVQQLIEAQPELCAYGDLAEPEHDHRVCQDQLQRGDEHGDQGADQ